MPSSCLPDQLLQRLYHFIQSVVSYVLLIQAWGSGCELAKVILLCVNEAANNTYGRWGDF